MDNQKGPMRVDGLTGSGYTTLDMEYPSNSHKQKAKAEQEKKIEKVVKGNVVLKKKPLSRKVAETFLGEDTKSVGRYLLYDVLIPAAKNTLFDMVNNGLEMRLFGEVRGKRTQRDKNKSFVSYSSYYNKEQGRRQVSSQNRARHNFDDIVLESRGEAEEVLSGLVDLIEEYGMASVADLYELVGVTSNFTDNKYGWINLSNASVSRVREGYLLDLPRPILLD